MPPVIAVIASAVGAFVQGFAFAGSYWVAYYATQAAIYYGISRVLTPKSSLASIREIGTEVNVRDPAAPKQIIYGRRRVSGVMYPAGTSGTKNEYLHVLLLVAGHEVEELGDLYFNDELVGLDGSGNGTGKWAGYVRVKKHLGAYNQAADSSLISEVTGWTANHKLQGIAYLYIRLKFNADLFGGIPEFYVIAKGRKVWDPRDGTQSSSDPSTWKYSANAALCLLDWVRGVPTRNSAGTIVRNYGLRAQDAEIDTTAAIEAANICDESVVLDDGSTEKRYEANGLLSTKVVAADGIEGIKSAMAGDCVYIGGKWVIRAGAYRTPTVTLTDSDLRAALTGVQFKPSRRELCNGVKGTYVSEKNAWQPADFPAITNATYTTQDGGERLWHDVEFPFTTSPACAQRLAKVILERSRQSITFTAKCKLSAMQVQPTDVVRWSHARFGWSTKTFEVLGFSFALETNGDGGPYLGCDLVLRETSSGVWSWANGEETAVDLAPNTDLPDPFAVPTPSGLTLASDSYRQADGTYIPVVKVTWTQAANQYVLEGGKVRIEYKKHADADWIVWSEQRGDAVVDYITAVQVGQAYDVRVQFQSSAGARSNANGSTTLNQYATVSSYTVTNDTTAPAKPANLAAVAGTGKAITLSWDQNTESDLDEYQVYRNTANDLATASLVAEVSSNRFVDLNVALAATYYYWVKAVDRSNNASIASDPANATTAAVPASQVDSTAPSTPSAPTISAGTGGTRLSSDGTSVAFVVLNLPTLPTGAVGFNVLYRKAGAAGWIIGNQAFSGGGTTSVDDLTPGTSYDFGIQAFSFSGASSSIATLLSQAAPSNTTAPTAPTASLISGEEAPPVAQGGLPMYAFGVAITASSSADIAYAEAKAVFSNSSSSIVYTWYAAGSLGLWSQAIDPGKTVNVFFYDVLGVTAGHVFVRLVSRSGIASTWTYVGNIQSSSSLIKRPLGTVAQYNSSDVTVTGIKTGGGSSTRQVNVVYSDSVVKTLTGGTLTETFNVDLTNRGFGAKPDLGWAQCSNDSNIVAAYDYDAAGNSSTNAVVRITTLDGTNLPSGLHRFHVEFTDYT